MKTQPKQLDRPRKPEMRACQVCGELRPEETIETRTFDVSRRFGAERLVYLTVDYCFERRVCRDGAQQMALRFLSGEDVVLKLEPGVRCRCGGTLQSRGTPNWQNRWVCQSCGAELSR